LGLPPVNVRRCWLPTVSVVGSRYG
jgi:hypothetical protein